MVKNLILLLVRIYQKYISPNMAPRCRYYPTCSAYAHQAILWHGVKRGLPLTIRRVASCHPWGGSGVDFVPVPLYLYQYLPASSNLVGLGVWVDGHDYRSRLNWLLTH